VATVGGDFATYIRERAAANELTARRYESDKEKIEQLQRFYDRFHAKKLKAKQAKAKLTQIERIKRDMKTRAATRAGCTWACRSRRPRRASCWS